MRSLDVVSDSSDGIRGSLLQNLANLKGAGGDENTAIQLMRNALQAKIDAYGEEHILTGLAYAGLANSLSRVGDATTSLELHRHALSIYRSAGDKHLIADALTDIVHLDPCSEQAMESINEAIELAQQDPEAWTVLATAHRQKAHLLESAGDMAGAVREARAAVHVARSRSPASNSLADALADHGRLLGAMGQQRAAVALLRRAILMMEEIHSDELTKLACFRGNLGLALMQVAAYEEGRALLEQSFLELKGLEGLDSPTTIRGATMLARGLLRHGYFHRVIEVVDEVEPHATGDLRDELETVKSLAADMVGAGIVISHRPRWPLLE